MRSTSEGRGRRDQLRDAAGFDRFAEIANAHVGDDKVPGLVAAVSVGDSVHVEVLVVVVVLTQRLFETMQAPQMHTDLQKAAYDAWR